MICPTCNSNNPDSAAYCTECGASLKSEGPGPTSDRCYVHPDVETGLTCGNCERPICVQCVVQYPVGIRCGECAQVRKLPQFNVPPFYYARAVGAGVGIAFVGSLALLILLVALPFGGLFILMGFVGIGYLVGEGISRAVNRKLSRGLQYIAGGSVLLSALLLGGLILSSLYGFLALAAAIYVALSRLRAP
ncbi:MAG: hypothetical protein O7F09_01505 [Chloroflexi bacterium]|nr:hypothetical protein [Chloroflexota bacterium]